MIAVDEFRLQIFLFSVLCRVVHNVRILEKFYLKLYLQP